MSEPKVLHVRTNDGTDLLCRALYDRSAIPQDYLGGGEAKMLYDAADELARLATRVKQLESGYDEVSTQRNRLAAEVRAKDAEIERLSAALAQAGRLSMADLASDTIRELRELRAKATPGTLSPVMRLLRGDWILGRIVSHQAEPVYEKDVIKLAAAAVNALPALLDAAEENARLREELALCRRFHTNEHKDRIAAHKDRVEAEDERDRLRERLAHAESVLERFQRGEPYYADWIKSAIESYRAVLAGEEVEE